MTVSKWIVIVLTAVNFVFMPFDGSRRLIIGADYIRPESGQYAGQQGLLVMSICSLSYLVLGTGLSGLQIIMILCLKFLK